MTKALPLPLLRRVQIASPCHVRWEDMTGDERVRHCAQCDLKVHNVAGMTEAEAEALLRASFADDGTPKQRLCAQVWRRPDGTIITADCPVGLAALRARAGRTAVRLAAAVGLTALVSALAAAEQRNVGAVAGMQPFTAVAKAVGLTRQRPVPVATGGLVCLPPTPAPSSPAPGGVR